ncbi:MAG: apolipoprotein N-acyltransferase [Isosphaeraceae bacterium]
MPVPPPLGAVPALPPCLLSEGAEPSSARAHRASDAQALLGSRSRHEREPPRSGIHPLVVLVVAAIVTPLIQAMAHANICPYWFAMVAFLPLVPLLDPGRWVRCWAWLGVQAASTTALTTLWIGLYQPGYDDLILPLSAYAAVVLGLPAALCCRAAASARAPVTGLLALPAGWALGEILARRSLLGVNWALVGLPLAEYSWLTPAVQLGGPETLSALTLAVPVSLALLIRKAPRWAIVAGMIQGPGVFVALAAWSALTMGRVPGASAMFPVALIQPNFPQGEAWTPDLRIKRLEFLDRLIDETRFSGTGLIVLPETAINGFVRFDDELTEWVKSVVVRTRRPLLFGSLDQEWTGSGPSNVAILITPDGGVTTYRKNRLVPVSESLPEVGPLRSWLVSLRGGTEQFTPGVEPTVFALTGGLRLAAPICYEDTLPDLARAFALAGARILISLTNTKRFDDTGLPDTHLRRARLSAAAVGLPMLRCTNSGVTCQIAADGQIVARLTGSNSKDRGFSAAAVFAVPLRSVMTPYRRFGDKLPLLILASLVGVFALVARRGNRRASG